MNNNKKEQQQPISPTFHIPQCEQKQSISPLYILPTFDQQSSHETRSEAHFIFHNVEEAACSQRSSRSKNFPLTVTLSFLLPSFLPSVPEGLRLQEVASIQSSLLSSSFLPRRFTISIVPIATRKIEATHFLPASSLSFINSNYIYAICMAASYVPSR